MTTSPFIMVVLTSLVMATLPFLICEFLLSKVSTIPLETSMSAEFIVINLTTTFVATHNTFFKLN